MAIDLKKMRSKLDKLEGKGRTQSVFWKPQDGDQTIRLKQKLAWIIHGMPNNLKSMENPDIFGLTTPETTEE